MLVETVGVTSNHPGVVHSGTPCGRRPAATGMHIDEYDAMSDGELFTLYAITATRPDGAWLRGAAIGDKGGPLRWSVALSVTDLPPASADTVLGRTDDSTTVPPATL